MGSHGRGAVYYILMIAALLTAQDHEMETSATNICRTAMLTSSQLLTYYFSKSHVPINNKITVAFWTRQFPESKQNNDYFLDDLSIITEKYTHGKQC